MHKIFHSKHGNWLSDMNQETISDASFLSLAAHGPLLGLAYDRYWTSICLDRRAFWQCHKASNSPAVLFQSSHPSAFSKYYKTASGWYYSSKAKQSSGLHSTSEWSRPVQSITLASCWDDDRKTRAVITINTADWTLSRILKMADDSPD